MFRGAATGWRFRDSWTRRNFLRAHGTAVARVAEIPYASSFDNAEDQMHVADWVARWEKEEEKEPRYVFSAEFAEQNPTLKLAG